VNVQEDNAKPQNIPTVNNGCVVTSKAEEITFSDNYVSELYVKLLNS
jgi:hypothetical protein